MTTQHDPTRRDIMVNLLNEDLAANSQRKNFWRAGSQVAKDLGFKRQPNRARGKSHIPRNYSDVRDGSTLWWIQCDCGFTTIKRQSFVTCRREWIKHRRHAYEKHAISR